MRDLRKWGLRSELILRCDQEPAIVDLMNKVSDLRASPTLVEHSPVGDSQANGLAERAVQSVQKQVRTLLLALERNLGMAIGVLHPCFPWLVEHAADVLNKFQLGKDGMSAWQRLKGRPYSGLMLEFGSKILHRVVQKPVGGEMVARWLPGIWLGKRFGSEEHVVCLENGQIAQTGTVRDHPDGLWDKEFFGRIRGSP